VDAGDERGYRVALIAEELVNPDGRGIDGLAALESAGWGVIQLPSRDYPDEVAAPLLELVAEQTEEFTRHGYTVAVIGRRAGLDEALAAYGVSGLPSIEPCSTAVLARFLAAQAGSDPERRP
jgi:hypothetical protein